MRRDLLVYLADLQQALSDLELFISSKSSDDYRKDLLLRRAVEREFIIVAEVIARIRKHFSEGYERIEHAQSIANFRNILVHEYESVDDDEVWRNATHAAPILHQQINEWVMELDPSWDRSQGL